MKSKKILYIGNKLSIHGNSPSSIDTLGVFFQELFTMFYASDKLNKIYRLFDMLKTTWKYRKEVDFVVIDTYSTINFYYAYSVGKLCQLLKINYVLVLRGGNLPIRLDSNPNLCRVLFSRSFANVAPSEYLKYEFYKRGYKTTYIPNNIEIKQYSFLQREKVSPKLLFVRSFHKIYNTPMAIHVLNELSKEYPEAELCMIGPDKDGSMQECKALANELNLLNKVTFTGSLSKQEWHKLSENYDIFISTTDFDNTPVSVMEAMALGLPVISTRVGGVPFLVEENEDALLVEKGNVQEMVQKIKFLLDDSNLQEVNRITRNARNKVEGFDWELIKKEWLKLLK